MNGLDEFRRMMLGAVANQAVGGVKAHEAVTPSWLSPQYTPPDIRQDTPPGKVGPGEMNMFERIIQGGLDLAGPPGLKGAGMAAAGIGARYGRTAPLESLKQLTEIAQLSHMKLLQQFIENPQSSHVPDKVIKDLIKEAQNISNSDALNALAGTPGKFSPNVVKAAEDALAAFFNKSSNLYDIEKKVNLQKITLPGDNEYEQMLRTSSALKKASKEIPDVTSFPIPPEAAGAGFLTPAVHATNVATPFTRFKLDTSDIGAHFGTPKAAAERIANTVSSYGGQAPRSYPVLLKANNPLELPDYGGFGPNDIRQALAHGKGDFKTEELARAPSSYGAMMDYYRDMILGRGYDSIKYTNMYENRGSPSYIMIKPDPQAPGYVSGIKSPFAKFKDLESSDIMSALAGLGLTGVAAGSTLRERQ